MRPLPALLLNAVLCALALGGPASADPGQDRAPRLRRAPASVEPRLPQELQRLIQRARRRPSPARAQALTEALQDPANRPHEAPIRLALADVFRSLHLDLLAAETYRTTLRRGTLDPDFRPALRGLAEIAERRDFDALLEPFLGEVAPEYYPRLSQDYLHAVNAVQRLRAGEPERAILAAEQVRASSVHAPRARLVLGLAQAQQGRLPPAIQAFDAVPNDAPQHDLARLNLARAQVGLGALTRALEVYDAIEGDTPEARRARFEGAWILFWQDRPEAVLSRLAPLRPRDRAELPEVLLLEAFALADLCRREAAIAKARELVGVAPPPPSESPRLTRIRAAEAAIDAELDRLELRRRGRPTAVLSASRASLMSLAKRLEKRRQTLTQAREARLRAQRDDLRIQAEVAIHDGLEGSACEPPRPY